MSLALSHSPWGRFCVCMPLQRRLQGAQAIRLLAQCRLGHRSCVPSLCGVDCDPSLSQGLILHSGAHLSPKAAHTSCPPAQPHSVWTSSVVLGCAHPIQARALAAVPLGDQSGLTGVGGESCSAKVSRAGSWLFYIIVLLCHCHHLSGDGHPGQRLRGASGAEHREGSFSPSSLPQLIPQTQLWSQLGSQHCGEDAG